VLQGAQYWQLKRADAALDEVVGPACQRVVGDSSTSTCQREVRQRLGESTGPATEDFLSTLAAIAAARDANVRIDLLSYRNRAMNLQLVVPDVTTAETFSRSLEQTRRFQVVLESTANVDEGTEARVRITGANP
jgi:hypothetical protein